GGPTDRPGAGRAGARPGAEPRVHPVPGGDRGGEAGRPGGGPVVQGPVRADGHEPLPGAGPGQRQGSVQRPGRHRRAGLPPPDRDAFWTPVGRLAVEGGASLRDIKARVEDPYQLVGMNALGLPGASIDGLLGFTVLARFRIELDPTKDRMTWTRLAFEPPDPP